MRYPVELYKNHALPMIRSGVPLLLPPFLGSLQSVQTDDRCTHCLGLRGLRNDSICAPSSTHHTSLPRTPCPFRVTQLFIRQENKKKNTSRKRGRTRIKIVHRNQTERICTVILLKHSSPQISGGYRVCRSRVAVQHPRLVHRGPAAGQAPASPNRVHGNLAAEELGADDLHREIRGVQIYDLFPE